MTFPIIRSCLFFLALFLLPTKYIWCQCTDEQVTVTSGSQQFGCTEVTVTSAGTTNSAYPNPCGYGPFIMGNGATGSYTLTFSPPIFGVSLNVQTLDNANGDVEELVVDVNGVFYPIVNPGIPDGCFGPAIIWPPGTIRAQPGGSNPASWQDITIMEVISTLKIEDFWISGTPAGVSVSVYICCGNCQTFAGEITSNPLYLCSDDLATTPLAEQTILESDDILQYILFSDQSNPTSSILATSNTPEFAFDPATMQTGVTYYIAAIAGNDLGGNVDLNDPCLDISNAIEVVWHPLPTVIFFAPNTEICSGGCQDIEVSFTGTPPFQLSGEVMLWSSIISTFTQIYLDNTGILTVCLPPDAALGSLDVNATELTDANCTCN